MNKRVEKYSDIHEELENEEQREKIKKAVILFFKIVFFITFISLSSFLYVKYISTNGIIIKEKRIVNERLPDSFHGTKIIQFSDIYYGSTVFSDEIKKVREKINIRKPDLVLFTGNLLSDTYNINEKETKNLIKELTRINSNIGKYAILTNDDSDEVESILRKSNFKILRNEYDLIYSDENNPIFLGGLDSNNEKDINKTFSYFNDENNNKNIYSIVMLENPDDIDSISNKNIDLALAGKSLNGEICLTSDLCMMKYNGAKKYFKEYYKVNNTEFYISSGIGTRDINFRFMARPSINFFRLAKQ